MNKLHGFILAAAALHLTACAPLINDVTTTPDDPPRFRRLAELPENKGRNMSYPAGNAAVQRKAYPDLTPIARTEAPDAAFVLVQAAARRMPRWTIVAEDAAGRVLEAVSSTRLMRFHDDVVIEVRPAASGSQIHARSKSRLGKGDLGANAARLRALAAELGRP